MRVALAAAHDGYFVFPLRPNGKAPALHGESRCPGLGVCSAVHQGWEQRASRNPEQIRQWWTARSYNVGISTGPSGLLVIDLDDARGDTPPPQWAGTRGGQDVLARLADAANQPYPGDTYTVATATGGRHLYFRAPADPVLRSTVGKLGWRIDTRGVGGYVVAAGSVRPEGRYQVVQDLPVAPLPQWLVTALTPPPPPEPVERALPAKRASAYVAAIVASETDAVAHATTGTRRNTLLHAANTLGRLVGGGELDEHTARTELLAAAEIHIGHQDFTHVEAVRTVEDGLAWGINHPRRITAHNGPM
ncbi:bifunctional DNA primase/polymerase [Saccharopolyspora sp. K220]|nr:bifunctional DNA primase/polymerase [Saccharopolyspora soli]